LLDVSHKINFTWGELIKLKKSQVLNQITPLGEGKEQIKSFKLTHNPILLNIKKTKVKTPFLNISIGSPNFSQTK